jgi:hypothetical protein
MEKIVELNTQETEEITQSDFTHLLHALKQNIKGLQTDLSDIRWQSLPSEKIDALLGHIGDPWARYRQLKYGNYSFESFWRNQIYQHSYHYNTEYPHQYKANEDLVLILKNQYPENFELLAILYRVIAIVEKYLKGDEDHCAYLINMLSSGLKMFSLYSTERRMVREDLNYIIDIDTCSRNTDEEKVTYLYKIGIHRSDM